MRILIANAKPDILLRAARFTALFADHMDAHITVMAISEKQGEQAMLEAKLQSIETLFAGQIVTKLVEGDEAESVIKETNQGDYNLIVMGTYKNRRFKRSQAQITVRQVINMVDIPVLIVPEERHALKRILICTAGTHHGELDTWVGGVMATAIKARVTILHVMSQLPLIAAAYEADLTRDAMEMIEHNTREGRHLKKVMGILYQAGLPDKDYTLKIRHGLVIDEIRAESREGDYDLIVVGAHEVPEEKSWNELRQLFQDNITGRLLTVARRPVLVVKAGPNGIRWPS